MSATLTLAEQSNGVQIVIYDC